MANRINMSWSNFIAIILLNAIAAALIGASAGIMFDSRNMGLGQPNLLSLNKLFPGKFEDEGPTKNVEVLNENSAVINVVERASPAVVSIIIAKDLPIIEKYYRLPSDPTDQGLGGDSSGPFDWPDEPIYEQRGTEKKEIGGGSGFLVSSDGYIVTNRHVVADEQASYTALLNDGTKHDVKVIAKDTANDVAIIKIEGKDFPYIELGESSNLKVGQSVISIGNSLGEFRNTVSTGVISGLSRNLTANGFGVSSEEQLTDVIQTDAAINLGNSGGPLLNIMGQAIGINTAIAMGAQNIGFSIPINDAKSMIQNVKQNGRYIKPWLGVRYLSLDRQLASTTGAIMDHGALIAKGENAAGGQEPGIVQNSPAQKAGLKEGDIILEIGDREIDGTNTLSKIVNEFKVGDSVKVKILRENKPMDVDLTFEEMKKE